MYKAISIAQADTKKFFLEKRKPVSELELQTSLYQIQKEAYRQTGKPLIAEQFFAGPEGPFIPVIRDRFSGANLCQEPENMDASALRIIEAALTPRSHPPIKDLAWRKARIPLSPHAEAAHPIPEEWIADEAVRERVRDERILRRT